MKRLLVCMGALVALAIGPSSVEAYPITVNDGDVLVFDTANTGQAACAGCEITMTFDFTGANLIITVDNTSTAPELLAVLSALGFDTTPTLGTGTLGGFFGGGAWSIAYNSNGGGLGGTYEILADANNNNFLGVDDGTGTISFAYTGSSIQLDNALVHIQRITAPEGSTKFICCTEGEGEGQNEAEGQGPEPASLLLFGMALSAAGVRMRKARR